MELKKVLTTIQEIENILNNQGIFKDARLENQLDNLNQVAYEIIKRNNKKGEINVTKCNVSS